MRIELPELDYTICTILRATFQKGPYECISFGFTYDLRSHKDLPSFVWGFLTARNIPISEVLVEMTYENRSDFDKLMSDMEAEAANHPLH